MPEKMIIAGDEMVLEPEGGWEFVISEDAKVSLESAGQVAAIDGDGKYLINEQDLMLAAAKIVGRMYKKPPYDKVPGVLGSATIEIEKLSELTTAMSPIATKATNGKLTITVMSPAQDVFPPGGVGAHPEPILSAKWKLVASQEIASSD
jgi:hypothetical protein